MNSQSSKRLTPFTCDLHIHSALSPCAENKMTPEHVVKKIISLGIDIFSITDHNSGFNSAAFEDAAIKNNLVFIPGIELQTSEEIHLLGYFPTVQQLQGFCSTIVKTNLTPNMKNDPEQFGHQIQINSSGHAIGEEEDMLIMPLILSIDELVEHIHDFNGLAVAAHIDRGFSLISQLGFIPEHLEIDAVEIWNISKIDEIKDKFLPNNNLNILSSSDSHHIDMMKPPKMKLWLKNPDVLSCINCIKGVGDGKITITSKKKASSTGLRMLPSDKNDQVTPRDWKNLYK